MLVKLTKGLQDTTLRLAGKKKVNQSKYLNPTHAKQRTCSSIINVKLDPNLYNKALQNWKISFKALTKRLWKLSIKTKRLSRLKLLSLVNVNYERLTINKQFLTKIGRNNEF